MHGIRQKKVNTQLGKLKIQDHTLIYDEIERRHGPTKICRFGHFRGSQTGVKHEGPFDVPIRHFELQGASLVNGSVIISHGDGLQGFCKTCSRRRRRARILKEINEKQTKTVDEIYHFYRTKYGTHVKRCSRCHLTKSLSDFHLSIHMECGLNNKCKQCVYEYGSSVGDRWIIYMPDGHFKYNRQHDRQHDTHVKLHDDHIFPLSLGGSDHALNHQFIDSCENLKKSNDLSHFQSVSHIDPMLLSERYRKVLSEVTTIDDLKVRLYHDVYQDIQMRHSLTDVELFELYKNYCEKNNVRRDIHRAIKKFRQYCSLRFKNHLPYSS